MIPDVSEKGAVTINPLELKGALNSKELKLNCKSDEVGE